MEKLPPELVEHILVYLPTVSSIISVAQTSKKLHNVVVHGQNTIYHGFIQRQFPSIAVDPPWQQAASDLTSRSRAWDRRAFIARECAPPRSGDETVHPNLRGQHFGFMPVIDSYETHGAEERKEVLAFGAAGRLRVRTMNGKSVKWSSWKTPNDASPRTDILDLHLLRPHQNRNRFGESVFIRRANRELALLNAMPESDNWVKTSEYLVKSDIPVDCLDVSQSADPLLAVCDSKHIQLFPLHTTQEPFRAETIVSLNETSTVKQRKRCAKFISDTRVAVATQHLEGLARAPIQVFDISPAGLTDTPVYSLHDLVSYNAKSTDLAGRVGANVLARVHDGTDSTNGTSNLLLSGWSDGLVRLYDLRSGNEAVRAYSDPVDDGQIFSLLPVGQERFLAGSHQNACLKVFDMRMEGQVYDYRNAAGHATTAPNIKSHPLGSSTMPRPPPRSNRGMNIFLALTVHRAAQPWQPLPGRHQSARLPRYRGSIYSLSSPSPSSRTVYAGIENHVIQLDFLNTDDWAANRSGIRDQLDDRPVLNLSCYERPRKGRESTDTVLLRKQADLDKCARNNAEAGWDERWQLEQQRTRKGMAAGRWSGRS